jgi:two-component system, NtrC family, response regulator AtoC
LIEVHEAEILPVRRIMFTEEKTTPYAPLARENVGEDRAYLLVFEPQSSRVFELPSNGEVVIGRTEGSGLMLQDSAVSRIHAKIRMADGEATLRDLGSHNGTRVNGRLIKEAHLVSNDVITICGVSLVFHAAESSAKPATLDVAQLRRRGEEEIERALRYQRPLAVLVIALAKEAVQREQIESALQGELRLIDVVGWVGFDQLAVLLPETEIDGALSVAMRLVVALERRGEDPRVGIASCPAQGCAIDVLLANARTASGEAESRGVAVARATHRKIELGERHIVVADAAMIRLYALLERLATGDLPVLLYGETGTGKEVAAHALHYWSRRRASPMVALNCAALPESLIESELFGHEKGAFTGAVSAKSGAFEAASGGTVFLDELGELSLSAQAKLLRVLETRRVMRLGDAAREREVDVRFVAATNRDLKVLVKEGRFREDLYFRLNVASVWIPPLRDRKQELPILAQTLLDEICERMSRPRMSVSDAALKVLATHAWPGNVRELRNVLEYVAAAFPDPTLDPAHLMEYLGLSSAPKLASFRAPPSTMVVERDNGGPPAVQSEGAPKFRPIDEEIRELEKSRIAAALEATSGNQTRAAQLIGMPLRTFVLKMKQYGLRGQTRPGA